MRLGIIQGGSVQPRLGLVAVLAMVVSAGLGCSVQSGTATESVSADDQFISVPLAATPSFNSHSGVVTVAMVDETAELYVNAADSSLMINGVKAVDTTVTPNVTAIAAGAKANIKTINVSDSTASVGDVVILNYINGVFGAGKATTAGTNVSLASGKANSLVLKGTAGNDYFAVGASGVTLDNTQKTPSKDIAASNVSTYSVFLGAGDDKFTAGGNSAIGAAFTAGVSVYGGAGNDTLIEGTATTAPETFSGGPGTDTVDYSARTAAVSVAVDPTGMITSGDSPTTAGDPTAGATEGDKILDAEVILGGSGNDQLMGVKSGSVTLNGGLGDDTFCEGDATYNGGSEILVGGGGNDTVDYSLRVAALTVVMDGKTASGDPLGNAHAGEGDKIGSDVAYVKLGSGGGSYTGNALDNKFVVNTAGTSVVYGLAGNDVLVEGPDANNAALDTFHGGAGTDTVDYSARTNALHVTMDNSTPSGDTTNHEADVIDIDVEDLLGGAGNDVLVGNALDNDIEGNAGDDVIAGLGGNDTLVGAAKSLGATITASGTGENNKLHGNDVADTAEPGAFNMCINIGATSTAATPGTATPTAANAIAANCELAQD